MSIRFNDVTCGYGKKEVLRHITFSVEAGDSVCILGPNGVGKTTLFNTLFGFNRPLAGSISINGTDISNLSEGEKAKLLSYVPQAHSYTYRFSVLETVLMGRASHIGRFSGPSSDDIGICRRCLAELDLSEFESRLFSELSGGEQQAVLIARALAQEATFIVMDEPSSNLDFENKRRLIRTVRGLSSRGQGVLMTSHSPEQAFECCSKVLLLRRDGESIFGLTEDVMTEDNLTNTYHLPIHVGTIGVDSGRFLKTCLPDYS